MKFFENPIRLRLFVAASSLITWVAGGTIAFHYLEGWSWMSSFYYSVVTLTTVGYGDLYPTTDISRLIAAFYILIGVAIVLAALTIFGTHYLDSQQKRHVKTQEMIKNRRKKRGA